MKAKQLLQTMLLIKTVGVFSLLHIQAKKFGLSGHIDWRVNSKREKVKEMMKFAWKGYAENAWGFNELNSELGVPHNESVFGSHHIGLSIIDSLDTLFIMGLKEEYEQGRKWVADNFTLDHIDGYLSVYELTGRIAGGLLSMYAITGDDVYITQSEYVIRKLLPAFNSSMHIPHARINPAAKKAAPHSWTPESLLGEIGSLNMEFYYTSEITGHRKYRPVVHHVRDQLDMLFKPRDMYPDYIHPRTALWGPLKMSMGPKGGGGLYECMLKSWLRSNQLDDQARDLYMKAIHQVINSMVGLSFGGLTYVGELSNFHVIRRMEHSTCFTGGLFALGSQAFYNDSQLEAKHLQLGKDLALTCRESYRRSATGLGPESFQFDSVPREDATARESDSKAYRLRPDVVETYLILWRLTHDQKYRDWGWEVVEALEKYCRTKFGFAGLQNVYDPKSPRDGVQGSHFLSETLKFLYLLFSKDSLLPLKKWVFNTAGHPLPVRYINNKFRGNQLKPYVHFSI
nr:mannosyl-oligosaccharide alpha-1,2-mannosidase IA-like [Drosophila suzukii]